MSNKIDQLATKLKKIKQMPDKNDLEFELADALLSKDSKGQMMEISIEAIQERLKPIEEQIKRLEQQEQELNKKKRELYDLARQFNDQIVTMQYGRREHGQNLVKWHLDRFGPDSDDDDEEEEE